MGLEESSFTTLKLSYYIVSEVMGCYSFKYKICHVLYTFCFLGSTCSLRGRQKLDKNEMKVFIMKKRWVEKLKMK